MLTNIDIDFTNSEQPRALVPLETSRASIGKRNRPELGRQLAVSAAASLLVFEAGAALDMTQPVEVTPAVTHAAQHGGASSHVSGDIERVADQRARLFALQDSGKDSVELQARLDLLTERLEKLDARVTVAHLDLIDQLVRSAEQRQQNLRRFEERFGF